MKHLVLPNVRKVIIPDPGYVMFEADLAGADAQVVAWEAEDDDLKLAFRSGIDVHAKNATDMLGPEFTRLVGHARDEKRQENKVAVHATNYLGSARAVATNLGWTTAFATAFQQRWFLKHPGIRTNFHNKTRDEIYQSKTVYNKFGFRRVYFGRPEDCLSEAVAWKPQSTVALTTFYGARQFEARYPRGEILLQTHDSLNFQFRKEEVPPYWEIKKTLEVTIPYKDPLIIPWSLTMSEKSWGDCQKVK